MWNEIAPEWPSMTDIRVVGPVIFLLLYITNSVNITWKLLSSIIISTVKYCMYFVVQ